MDLSRLGTVLVTRWGAATDAGPVRRRNEDSWLAEPPLYAVADGMGGHADGATANIQILALVCGLAAVFIATTIPRILRNDSTLMLVLSGVIVAGFATALIGLLKFIADPETQLPAITFWQLGSLAHVRASQATQLAIVSLPCLLGLILLRWRINILSLGDTEARTLGIHLRRIRGIIILLATILTAASVCISGTIAWVGLVVPHLCRLLIGADNSKVIPLSITIGASFMLVVDTLARSLSQEEIPLSVVTGFIGAPLFLGLLALGRVRIK